jgi:hypothetical protein
MAAMLEANRRVTSAVLFDPWDLAWFGSCWHSATWREQHEHRIVRPKLKSHEVKPDALKPAALTTRPGRKKNKPLTAGSTKQHKCWRCGKKGHHGATCGEGDVDTVLKSKAKETKKTLASFIDLTNGDGE